MKWKSHVAIARAISKEMDLPEELEHALCIGSVEPDTRPDAAYWRNRNGRLYIGRAPHHQPPTGTIMAYVWRARKAYLLGNTYWAVKSVGRALHYVQDKSVSTGFLGWSHDSRESDVAQVQPPSRAVQRGLDHAVCSPLFVRECISQVRPKRDPYEVMYQATMFSAAIFASVLGSVSHVRIDEEYRRARRGHLLRLPIAAALLGASALGAYWLREPLLLGPGMLASYAAVRIDPRYHRLRDELEWYAAE